MCSPRAFIRAMDEDAASLGVARPDHEPRATGHIAHIIALIERAHHARPCLCRHRRRCHVFGIELRRLRTAPPARSSKTLRAGCTASASMPPSAIHWISCCGSAPSPASRAGLRRGVRAVPAGTSSARPCPSPCWANTSTSMAAVWDPEIPRTMKTRSRRAAAPLVRISPTCGCTNGFVNVDSEKMSKSLDNFFTLREVLPQLAPSRGAALLPDRQPLPAGRSTTRWENLQQSDATLGGFLQRTAWRAGGRGGRLPRAALARTSSRAAMGR